MHPADVVGIACSAGLAPLSIRDQRGATHTGKRIRIEVPAVSERIGCRNRTVERADASTAEVRVDLVPTKDEIVYQIVSQSRGQIC